jgi:hypothetical protein
LSTPAPSYALLPFVRSGVGAGAATAAGTARSTVHVTVELATSGGASESVAIDARLYGPGDVTGFDPRQVIRMEPAPFTADFEPNHLAAVEFDTPELPWLLTPDAPDAAGKLRPWLCLLIVRKDRAAIAADPASGRPVLTISDKTELPDLAGSWAWAHAQVVRAGDDTDQVLASVPERNLARLLAPRSLTPLTSYYACVVPTFEAGRQAGLGLEVKATLEPAWTASTPMPLRLPVYHSWEFDTATTGDFPTLARRLQARRLNDVGRRPLDVSAPWPQFPSTPAGATLGLEGALRSPIAPGQSERDAWADPPRSNFEQRLRELTQAPAAAADPVVAPPLYGQWQAARAADGTFPDWLWQLNLDPRFRAAAGFGARVVQDEQEELMASAWDQAGEIRRANQLLHAAQLARATANALLTGRIRPLGEKRAPRLLHLTAPAHSRLPAAPAAAATVEAAIDRSAFPAPAVSVGFRRVVGAGGPIGKRLPAAEADVGSFITGLAQNAIAVETTAIPAGTRRLDAVVRADPGELSNVPGWKLIAEMRTEVAAAPAPRPAPAPAPTPGGGTVPTTVLAPDPAPRQAREQTGEATDVVALAGSATRLPDDAGPILEPAERRDRLVGMRRRFRAAVNEYVTLYRDAPVTNGPAPPAPAADPLAVDAIGKTLVTPTGTQPAPLDPEHTLPTEILPRLNGVPLPTREDPLAPLLITPRFPQPMSTPLRALSQELILPAAESVPDDTIGLLQGNGVFIEAYMLGLNHEFSRELLWRGYPSDLRGTYFRQFWDIRGRYGAGHTAAEDIPEISAWSRAQPLGHHATGIGDGGMVVLLVRGALVRRYPTLTLYAVHASDRTTLGTTELSPDFQGTLDPDILYAGFNLTQTQAVGTASDPGWFFVFQEHATAPRFAIDGAAPSAAANGADFAAKTLRRPTRLAVHAATLLPKPAQ